MQWLTAILAFATTMLILTIVVSTFTELVHRLLNLRGQALHRMLTLLFDDAIGPRLFGHGEVDKATHDAALKAAKAVADAFANPPQGADPAMEAVAALEQSKSAAIAAAATAKDAVLKAELDVDAPPVAETKEAFVRSRKQHEMVQAAVAAAYTAIHAAVQKANADSLPGVAPAQKADTLRIAAAKAAKAYPPPAGTFGVMASDFADSILRNRARTAGTPGKQGFVPWPFREPRVESIAVEVFSQKLADPKILGGVVLTADEIKDIGQKFTAYGAEATEFFRSRARVISTLLAIPVAIAFYVHPYDLAVAYMRDAELAAKVAKLSDDATKAYEAMEKSFEANALVGPAPAQAEGTAKTTEADRKTAAEVLEDVRTVVENAKAETAELAKLGVPIGWPDAALRVRDCGHTRADLDKTLTSLKSPQTAEDRKALEAAKAKLDAYLVTPEFCRVSAQAPSFWAKVASDALPAWLVPAIWPGWSNILWLLLGGLLVGLGSPFWAQAVSSITASRAAADKITEIVTGKPPVDKQATQPPADPAKVQKDAVVAAHQLARIP